MDSVTKHVQSDSASLAEVRATLSDVLSQYPDPLKHLNQQAYIILYSNFESAIAKIQDGKGKDLTASKNSPMKYLLKTEFCHQVTHLVIYHLQNMF